MGRPTAIEYSTPPMGVATNMSTPTCAAWMRPFARSRLSLPTTDGVTAVVALSNSVSPRPKMSVAIASHATVR